MRELGFGLLVAPNTIAALREVSVAHVVLARGFAPTRGEVRRMDGTLLRRAEFPPAEAMGGPTVLALRSAPQGALLEAVREDAVTLHREVTGSRDGRPCHSANGGRATSLRETCSSASAPTVLDR